MTPAPYAPKPSWGRGRETEAGTKFCDGERKYLLSIHTASERIGTEFVINGLGPLLSCLGFRRAYADLR